MDTPCKEWDGPFTRDGYGRWYYRKNGRQTTTTAHRAIWVLHNGPVPDGMKVCHRCDNRGCVNPDHLFLGTQLDNMRDMQAKGRQNYGHGGRPFAYPVDEIKAAIRDGVRGMELAKRFGANKSTAYRWQKIFDTV